MSNETPINMSLDDLRQEVHGVLRGERPSPLASAEPVSKVLAPESMEVLRVLVLHSPDSVRALAKHLGRSEPNVSRTLSMLHRHGLIRMVRQGQQVRPVVLAQNICIDLDCTTGAFTAKQAAA
jgi:predicted transcriptional regulator